MALHAPEKARRAGLACTLWIAAAAAGCRASEPAPPPGPEETLAAVLEGWFEEHLERDPVAASAIGDERYQDRYPNRLAPEYLAEERAFHERWLARALALDRAALAPEGRLSLDVFVYERRTDLAGLAFPAHLLPLDQFTNFASDFAQLGSGRSLHPFEDAQDYRDFQARARGFAELVDQAIANMRLGMARDLVQPRPLIEKTLPQLAAHVVERAEDSVFHAPLEELPAGLGAAEREGLLRAHRETILEVLVPAYRRLHAFVAEEYLPACRETVGLSALPGGAERYAYLVRRHTTTELTPDEVHAFGRDEVARIQDEMRGVLGDLAFEGGLEDFFAHLATDDRFYFDEPEALVAAYEELRARIDAALPELFDLFPATSYEVRPVPAFMAESAAGAFYQPGTPDGSRPGVFYVNTFNLRAQPKFGMETLSLHEASPGHHFQISIAQELEALPRFRRFGGTSAYVEGWALYAESLGPELGLFQDPYARYGHLSDELLRAMRLVVDTGLHHLGWSREEAVQYMLENSSMAESDVVAEVERYIAVPGQALSYKIGQRVIAGLRRTGEETLGEDFDVRGFHRTVLASGALPMGILERVLEDWIESERAAAG